MDLGRRKRTNREDDRHSGHCESKPRTADSKAALAVEVKPRRVRLGDDEARMVNALSQGRVMDDMSVVRKKIGHGVDVAEVYSPPRIVTVAEAAGLRGGFSLDLTVPYMGERWDFDKRSCREKALELLRNDKPYLLIGSPPCTAWSNLQNLNACRPGGQAKVDAAKQRARVHLLFCIRLYRE